MHVSYQNPTEATDSATVNRNRSMESFSYPSSSQCPANSSNRSNPSSPSSPTSPQSAPVSTAGSRTNSVSGPAGRNFEGNFSRRYSENYPGNDGNYTTSATIWSFNEPLLYYKSCQPVRAHIVRHTSTSSEPGELTWDGSIRNHFRRPSIAVQFDEPESIDGK